MQPLPCSHSFPGWDGGLFSAPAVVWHLILSDLSIAAAYAVLSLGLFVYATSKRGSPPFPDMILLLVLVFASCGVTHVFNIVVLFFPSFWGEAVANWATVSFSAIAVVFWRMRYHGIINYTEANDFFRRYVQRRQDELLDRLEVVEQQQRESDGNKP